MTARYLNALFLLASLGASPPAERRGFLEVLLSEL
jgi:hypothetical protein